MDWAGAAWWGGSISLGGSRGWTGVPARTRRPQLVRPPGVASGSVKENVAPRPGSLAAPIRPP
jgi:hypothetical protein